MMGERLRLLRTERDITQEQLGKSLGIGKTAISQYENGVRRPDADMLRRMAEFFCVSTDYLLGLDQKIRDSLFLEDKALYDLPAEVRQFLKDFQEFICKRYGKKKGKNSFPDDDSGLSEFVEEFNRREDLRLLFQQVKSLSPEAVRRIASLAEMMKGEQNSTN
jgi:transcriptional regulator with XRE-family HTH domain